MSPQLKASQKNVIRNLLVVDVNREWRLLVGPSQCLTAAAVDVRDVMCKQPIVGGAVILAKWMNTLLMALEALHEETQVLVPLVSMA